MVGTYSIVRPYPGTLGAKVEALIASLELTPSLGQPPAAGTPDEYTARWISRNTAQLFVVPFHYHRGTAQDRLDGIGVLLSLPSSFPIHARVLFMPVRDFSWSTSFAARFERLRKERPDLAERVIVAHESELDSPSLFVRLRRALQAARDQRSRPPASRRPASMHPPSGPASERFSLEPTTATRASGAWKFTLPPDPAAPSIPPVSGSRPSRAASQDVSPFSSSKPEKKTGG